jgi:hypothetical protein
MKWLIVIGLVFVVDSVKVDTGLRVRTFDELKVIVTEKDKDVMRQHKMDDINIKLDSILNALPDTVNNELKKR